MTDDIYGDSMVATARWPKRGKLGWGRGKWEMYENWIKDENANFEIESDDEIDDDLQVIAEADWDSDDDLFK